MTIFYPDISSAQTDISLNGAQAVCCKATESTNYDNPDFPRARANAAANDTFFFAYHFLHHGNAAKQAQWCYMNVGSFTGLMLDIEPTIGSAPTIADVDAFVTAYRKLGGKLHLLYLPHWYWQQLGSPDLSGLKEADLRIVSSNYVAYSDNGPGWNGYGGATPAVWQYSDGIRFNGFKVDFNAYRGTVAELASIVRTGHLPVAPPVLKNAANPVENLWASSRYTQADVGCNKAPGATSYRFILYRNGKRVQQHEVKDNKFTFVDLQEETKYTVTALALPAKLTDTISGRSRTSFTTK